MVQKVAQMGDFLEAAVVSIVEKKRWDAKDRTIGCFFFTEQFQQKMQSLELAQSKRSFEVTGQTIAQNLASVPDLDFGAQGVILPLERLIGLRLQGCGRRELIESNS